MLSFSAITILLFGITAMIAGLRSMLNPSAALSQFALPPSARPVLTATGLAAFAVGVYYVLLAWQENRAFFLLTIPIRCLSAVVFASQGGAWVQVGAWEGFGAGLTAFAMVYETVRGV